MFIIIEKGMCASCTVCVTPAAKCKANQMKHWQSTVKLGRNGVHYWAYVIDSSYSKKEGRCHLCNVHQPEEKLHHCWPVKFKHDWVSWPFSQKRKPWSLKQGWVKNEQINEILKSYEHEPKCTPQNPCLWARLIWKLVFRIGLKMSN